MTIARRFRSLATHRLHALPVLVLMPHSRCNCRCVMCDIWKANAQRRELDRADLEPHVETMRRLGVSYVALSGGEALMHSNLWALCDLLREAGIRLSLLSTGLLLRRHAAEIIQNVDEVIVSLDGPRDVHDAIRRVPNAYEKLADGLVALRDLAPGLPISGRSVVQRANFRVLPETIGAAHEIGLDRISFLAVDVETTAFNREEPWDEPRADEVSLGREEVEDFRQIVERTLVERRADFDDGFVAESPEKFRRIVQYFAARTGDTEPPVPRCNAPWVSAVIEADGEVRPCFFHPSYGNLREAPLDEILNAPAAVDFRRRLDVRRDPTCRGCVCTLHLNPWSTP